MIESCPLGHIAPNPFQPRQNIGDVQQLADNIYASRDAVPDTLGLLQVPRGRRIGDIIQLAYGHRRLAAFAALVENGHSEYALFPVDLVELSDIDMAVIAWSENSQREDVNPMDEALFLRRLLDEFGWSIDELGRRLGCSGGTLHNTVRLANLPEDIQQQVRSGEIKKSQAFQYCGAMAYMDTDKLREFIAQTKHLDHVSISNHVGKVRLTTRIGQELSSQVIAPASQALAANLRSNNPGAWRIISMAVNPKADAVETMDDLATLVIEQITRRAQSLGDGRRRVSERFESVNLPSPWNSKAQQMVSQYLEWRYKSDRPPTKRRRDKRLAE